MMAASQLQSKLTELLHEMQTNALNDVDIAPTGAGSTPISSTPALPLGWTRVKRKRRDGEECCEDPSCQRRRAPLTSASVSSGESSSKSTTHRGTAIFCLHETNPEWFQGYFFHERTSSPPANTPFFPSTRKAWGLLGEQQEIDDCLKCAEGGYRVISLTVYPFRDSSQGHTTPTKVVIPDVEWTGGDMVRLLQAEGRVRLEPQQLWTEEKAVPYVQGVFGSLVRQLAALQDQDEVGANDASARSKSSEKALHAGVLEIMPDVAIVVGAMELVLPSFDQQDDSGFE